MADEGKPPTGRGAGPGRGGQRKSKFVPTVPSQRRRRQDDAGPSSSASAAEAAAANDAFQELIRAAQSESKWVRGRGRGRGRGAAPATVMFGGDGSDMRRTAVAPQLRAPARVKGEQKDGVKGEGGSSSSSRRRLKPNVKLDGKADGAAADGYDEYDDSDASSEGGRDLSTLFDYEQYFPTTLPLSLHHPCDGEADAVADAGVMRQGLPEELALRQDDSESSTAQQLGLHDLATAQDTLFLFQLPSLLPLGLPADSSSRRPRSAAAAAAAAGSSSSSVPLRPATAQELPSGPVGKLLVFKSGRVKLQMGSCLLDVSAGMPCVSRQDVAAINKATGHLIQLGPVTQRAVVCPDVWQLMTNQEIPQFRRDLQQQLQEGATNGFGSLHAMEVEDQLEDDLGGVVKQQQQQREIGSAEGDDGSDPEQQQQQLQRVKAEQQRRRAAHQIGSSSEEEPEAKPPDLKQQQQQDGAAAAEAALPPKQQQQQPALPQQLVGNGALGWLDLPSAPAARGAAARGRGKFRPSSTRSPSPAAAAVPPPGAAAAAAAAAPGAAAQQADAMDVDS